MSITDNLGKWRESEATRLANKVQQRFNQLQNPADCDASKKILCDLNKACGYGCQIHHVMYCFITAYFTNRTMILQSSSWRYNNMGFTAYFEPLSSKCLSLDKNEKIVDWNCK